MSPRAEAERQEVTARHDALRGRYLLPSGRQPASSGPRIHHAALVCSEPEQTIGFYQGLLGFPLVELVENRDELMSFGGRRLDGS